DGIDLEVRSGEIMVIMGVSGSGKSTLLRLLLGLLQPTRGSIRIMGHDVTRAGTRELYRLREQLGVAFQGGAMLGSLTIGENVALPLTEHTDLDAKTIRIITRMKLEMMGLSDVEDMMPAQLSGGMLKRAGLARAIVMDPKILFFDEPSAGLDPVTAVELDERILLARRAMNLTIVVVTHELESAIKIADRITVIQDGRVLETGTVGEIRDSDDEHIQDMLHRRPRNEVIDADAYLDRLTR
ncbi:MAG: ATP-binding cassette domain-containing protein, partial [Pseudomonadota bacterium]|nr:ATP-binding cassette domain-containing protein [Pseudomonadota bacterium]